MSKNSGKSLGLPSVQCIIKRMDAVSRFCLTLSCPSLRPIEKLVPLTIEKLGISNTYLQINDVSFLTGEVQESPQRPNQRRVFPHGEEWRRGSEHITPGDIVVMRRETLIDYCSNSGRQSLFAEVQESRRLFLKALEDHLKHPDTNFNPLKILDLYLNPTHEKRRCLTLDQSEIFYNFLNFASDEFAVPDNLLVQDFPLALEELKNQLEEFSRKLTGNREDLENRRLARKAAILMNIAFPTDTIPYFNQFAVFDSEERLFFKNRIPDGVSVRDSFKKLATLLLGNRPVIRVNEAFLQTNVGIVGWPVGVRLCIRKFRGSLANDNFFELFEDVIDESTFPMEVVGLIPINSGVMRHPKIASCKKLLFATMRNETAVNLQNVAALPNKHLQLYMTTMPNVLDLIGFWRQKDVGFELTIDPFERGADRWARIKQHFAAVDGTFDGGKQCLIIPTDRQTEVIVSEIEGEGTISHRQETLLHFEIKEPGTAVPVGSEEE